MSTLADELLNDFEDSGSEGEAETENGGLFPEADGHAPTTNGNGETMELDGDEEEMEEDEDMTGAGNAIDVMDDEEATKAKVEKMQLGGVDDVRSVAGLMKTLEPVLEVSTPPFPTPSLNRGLHLLSVIVLTSSARLQKISYFQNLPADQQTTHVGSIEDNPEYHLLTQSNTLSTSIDNEIILVHKFIRDHYSTRFPELETMVQNPLDYAKVVAIIGNGPMNSENIKRLQTSTDNILGTTLRAVLDGPSLMIVTVEATTTKGRALTPSELSRVLRACEMTLSLDRAKRTLTDYVQSRMTLFAPNLTALIGSLTAAQLLNFAGGLTGLAKTPACNLASLGSKKTAGTGFATNVGARQQGFLYHSPIIAGVPPDLRRQAQRIVAAKLVLAARVDRVHSSPSGATGEELKAACLERLEKLTIPPPNKGARALPAPDDKPSRKRGGRRARKAKEATAMTDLRKAQNRMVFGKEEVEGGGDKQGVEEGRVRRLQIDPRTRAKLGKKNPGWGAATPAPGSGTASSLRGFGGGVGAMDLRGKGLRGGGVGAAGTASSVVFTPVQGLELVDPKVRDEVARKRKAEEEGWFKGGTFTQ
ncbi:hypothetical protein V501_10137, partial [Pseudogymnoascus sp. VKM F-4519 (FW-2642)]